MRVAHLVVRRSEDVAATRVEHDVPDPVVVSLKAVNELSTAGVVEAHVLVAAD